MTPSLVSSLPVSIAMPRFSLKLFWVCVFFTFLSLLVLSVVQLNAQTQENYLIFGQERKLIQLIEESKALEINFSQVNSLKEVRDYVQAQVFEKAEKIEYIRVLGSTALAK
ncbi:MAG: hypothetical protein ABIG08_01190 [bacterium]